MRGEMAEALFLEEIADTKFVEVVGQIFQQRVVMPRFIGQEPNQEIIDAAMASLPAILSIIEGRLAKQTGAWAASDTISVADLALVSMTRQLELAGETIDAERWPQLSALNEEFKKRASFTTTADLEQTSMGG